MEARSYRILGLLGEGGFGRVYRARLEDETGFSQEVALKLLHGENPDETVLQRFRDEARILGLVRDRAFVRVNPPVRLEGQWGVVMEYVDGCTLDALLRRFGPMPAGSAAELLGELARAFHAASSQAGPDGVPIELIHRDLKPANIQITPTGEVKVLDFGIARATFEHREFQTEATIGGTPGYIAPERLRGIERPAGDIYSLGVVLAECLHGKEVDALAEVSRTVTRTAADLDEAGAPEAIDSALYTESGLALAALAHAMCDTDPDRRPTARQIERECSEIARSVPNQGLREWAEKHVPPTMEEPASDELVGRDLVTTLRSTRGGSQQAGAQPGGRPRWQMPALGLAALLLVGAGGWWASQQGGGDAPDLAAPEPTPAPFPEPVPPQPRPEPAAAEPQPEPEPQPAPARPEPAAQPRPAPAPAGPPVRLWVKTKPFGSVSVDGQQSQTDQWIEGVRSGRQVLELRSTDGRAHTWEVDLPPGQDSRLCWDFEKEAPC